MNNQKIKSAIESAIDFLKDAQNKITTAGQRRDIRQEEKIDEIIHALKNALKELG